MAQSQVTALPTDTSQQFLAPDGQTVVARFGNAAAEASHVSASAFEERDNVVRDIDLAPLHVIAPKRHEVAVEA